MWTKPWRPHATRPRRPPKISKPHIDDVALAFHHFHESVRRTCREQLRHPKKMREELTKAQKTLKSQMAKMRLAALIDWTEKD